MVARELGDDCEAPHKKNDYSKPKEQWILRYDAQAVAARAAKETPKYSVEEAQAILRSIAMFAVSTDEKDLPVLALLKKKGIDAAYFATFAHCQDRLNALSIAGAADPRVEVVISPAEKQRVDEIYQVFSALRGAAGKALRIGRARRRYRADRPRQPGRAHSARSPRRPPAVPHQCQAGRGAPRRRGHRGSGAD